MKECTVVDVAREAGVSQSTVSAVLNNYRMVRQETRERVLEVAKRLGYVPNTTARELVKRRNATPRNAPFTMAIWGGIVGDGTEQIVSRILYGAASVLREHERVVQVEYLPPDYYDVTQMPLSVRNRLSAGVIVVGGAAEAFLVHLRRMKIPYVVAEGSSFGIDSDMVYVDNVRAMSQATDHLLDLGHTKIGVISGGPATSHPTEERLRGIRHALAARNRSLDERYLIPADMTYSGGAAAMRRLLAMDSTVTAVIAMNDMSAAGAIKSIQEAGLAVPGDISVCGFDDIPLAAQLDVPLTTMRTPQEMVGRIAAQRLLQLVENPDQPPVKTILSAELVARASTAVPRADDLYGGGGGR